MSAALRCKTVIIGAGVVGLAIARQLAEADTWVLDQAPRFGTGASSRNSEVVHSGIYYPLESLKTHACIEGRQLLRQYAAERGIFLRLTGKWVVACAEQELGALHVLSAHARELGIEHELFSAGSVANHEPQIQCVEALFFPGSGIVDSHALMRALEMDAREKGVVFAYGHTVVGAETDSNGYRLRVVGPEGESLWLHAQTVINAAGFESARLSNVALGTQRYEHRACWGRYMAVNSRLGVQRLVYPLPEKDGLGIHLTLDRAGEARLGPDVDWEGPATEHGQGPLDCDWSSIQQKFFMAARKYLPQLEAADLRPGLVGVRPKLYVDAVAHPDFLIERHGAWIHCLGIESPGLTAALSIAQRVATEHRHRDTL